MPNSKQNRKAIRLVFLANGISGFAQGISMLAVPWYFSTLNEPGYFKAAYGVVTLLVIFWGLYAGTLVDRFNRSKVFFYLNLLCGIVFALLALPGFFGGGMSHLMVMAVFGITMFNYNVHYPTLYALGHEITQPEDYKRFNSNIEIVGQSVSILSGGIAAIMLDGLKTGTSFDLLGHQFTIPFGFPAWGIHEIIALNAFAHFVAAAFVSAIHYTPIRVRHIDTGPLKERLISGFHFLQKHRGALLFGLGSYMVFAMLLVEVHAVLPSYVEKHLKAGGAVFAIADGIYAVGAFFAGVGIRHMFAKSDNVKAIAAMMFVVACFFAWNTFSRSVGITLLMSLVLGYCNAGIRILRLSWLFAHLPNEVMGRVNSIFNVANLIVRSLFIFLFTIPWFDTGNNIRWSYSIMAGVILLAIPLLFWKTKKKVEA